MGECSNCVKSSDAPSGPQMTTLVLPSACPHVFLSGLALSVHFAKQVDPCSASKIAVTFSLNNAVTVLRHFRLPHRLSSGLQVQGVFFRSSTVNEAKKLGVVGWVKNTSAGTVQGQVQGDSDAAAKMKVMHSLLSPFEISKCMRETLAASYVMVLRGSFMRCVLSLHERFSHLKV